jgi:transcriptional regulator with XRE-family HTH domain
LGEVLAENIRGCRLLRRLNQEDLAERMRALGHEQWVRATVSEVERYGRNVTVDELFALALALNATPGTLLEPTGVDGSQKADLDVGSATFPCFFFAGWASSSPREGAHAEANWDGNAFRGIGLYGASQEEEGE